jgi:23S rRNA pseudouridine1911/1915/1917 synthase
MKSSVEPRIVFEDAFIIVVDKPAGLLTVATETEQSKTLYAALRERAKSKRPSEKIFIVHRLDREASGLLVFAKTMEAKDRLQDQFRDHSAGRRYIAVVDGQVHRVYSTPNKKMGKLAITHIHVLKRNAKTTLLEIRLETGRKHQIRVHLAERGNPIIGDKSYGKGPNSIRRLALHGTDLELRHPATGALMHFDSKYPRAFDAF